MDKTPLIAITPHPLDIWYEGPTVVIADKPAGMAVHPAAPEGTGTLVNALLDANRWLAEMETSHTPGVIHTLAEADRGLVIIAKSDETAAELRELYHQGQIIFSYRVRFDAGITPDRSAPVSVFDHQVYGDGQVWDIDSPLGDTDELRHRWLTHAASAHFVCYRVAVPMAAKPLSIGLGERIRLPRIDLYTAPPCSVCNGTKAFLSAYGFGYRDHSLTDEANIQRMRELRQGHERGIPVMDMDGQISVGLDRRRLKSALGLY